VTLIPGQQEPSGLPALYTGLGYVLAQIVMMVVLFLVPSFLGMIFFVLSFGEIFVGADASEAPPLDLAPLIGACLGFLVGLVIWFRVSFVWEMLFPEENDSHGSARFADEAELELLGITPGLSATARSPLLIGSDIRSGAFLRYDGPAHLMTLAPTRSGKGVGTIIPNLLRVDRSVLVIDPKGENARITGDARLGFGELHVLDPFGISGHPSAAFNPLAELDPNSMDLGEDAAALADALVFDPPDQVKDSHWNEEAKALVTGFILWCVCHEPPEMRTLGRLRQLLTASLEDRAKLLVAMQDSTTAGGLIARAANRHLAKPEREAGSVLSNAQRHTHFLDSPRMVSVTDSSSFRFADLTKRTVSVFVVLPPDRLDVYARWLRLIIGQALQDIVRAAQGGDEGATNRAGHADADGGAGDVLNEGNGVQDLASLAPQRGGIEGNVAIASGEDLGEASPAPPGAETAADALLAFQRATEALKATTGAVAASEGLVGAHVGETMAVEHEEALGASRGALEGQWADLGGTATETPAEGAQTARKAVQEVDWWDEGSVTGEEAGAAAYDARDAAQAGNGGLGIEDAPSRVHAVPSATPAPDADLQEAKHQNQNAGPRPPTLFLLDEFASLGRLSAVERAMGLMAGYGVQLWPILQDLSQLKVLYGESANTFMANSGVVQTFGVNDYETAKWLSLLLGQQTRYFQTSDHMGETEKNVHARDLLTPDEIMLLDPSLQILKIQNMRPVVAKKITYYSDPRFDPNWVEPEVKEFEVQAHDSQNPRFTRQAKRHERKR